VWAFAMARFHGRSSDRSMSIVADAADGGDYPDCPPSQPPLAAEDNLKHQRERRNKQRPDQRAHWRSCLLLTLDSEDRKMRTSREIRSCGQSTSFEPSPHPFC